MTKKYISKIRQSLTLKNKVTIDGEEKIVGVSFTRPNITGSKCYFITDNPAEQLAIEESREFKNGFIDIEEGGVADEGGNNTSTISKEGFTELVADKKQLAIEELKNLFPDVEIKLPITNRELEDIANGLRCTFVNLTF